MKFDFVTVNDSGINIIDGDRGKNYPKQSELRSSGYCVFLSTTDISNNKISLSNCSYIPRERDALLGKGKIEFNDIILTTRGNGVGKMGLFNYKLPARINSGQVIIRNESSEFDTKYLFYVLTSKYCMEQIKSLSSGSAQPQLPIRDLKRMQLIKQPLETQKKIAHILSTLDEKIELNRKMNQTLEEMVQALFKSWFVDFDPVHAKANCSSDEELEVAAKELGISKEILELFPSEFEESELGMIPRGWGIFKLGDVTRFQQGKQIELEDQFLEKTNEMTRFVRIIDYTSENEAPRYIKVSKESSSYVTEDDVVMIRYGSQTAGKVVMGKSGIIANNMFRVIPIIDNLQREYLYYFLKSPNVYSHLRDGQSSSTMPAITFGLMASLDIVLPEQEIVVKFNQLIKSFITKYFENDKQIETLQKTRDTLLPKLLSGELDVSELDLDVE